jgi:D-hydroxyproline dehydrogenase subunit alpha
MVAHEAIAVRVNGQTIEVPRGSMATAALALAGVDATRQSVAGEPRGPVCGMGICFECCAMVNGRRVRTCQTVCQPGMEIDTVSGTLRVPPVSPTSGTRSVPDTRFDILVVGAGPAGIAAACAAGKNASVGVVDDNPTPGGQIWRGGVPPLGDKVASNWLEQFLQANIVRMHGTQIVAQPERGVLLAERGGEPIELRYGKLILATGARERFIPFPGWTMPNVAGLGGIPALVKSGVPVGGKRIIVAGSGPLLLSVAAFLRAHGAIVPLVAEQAPWHRVARFGLQLAWLSPSKLLQGAAYRWALRNTRYNLGCWPTAVHGNAKVEAVTFRSGGQTWTEPCDVLACGFGLVPNLELPILLGCNVRDQAVVVDDWQESTVSGVYCAGEITGIGGAELALVEGLIAGYAATGRKDIVKYESSRNRGGRFAKALDRAFALRQELRDLPDDDTLICRCEDVARKQLASYNSWREAKLYTRCGMGPCQGRVCGPAAELVFGWKHESVRPPVFPASVETLARKTEK